MTRNYFRRFWAATLMWFPLIAVPVTSGCETKEEPKTQQQIEESRIKHQEASRKEWEG